MEKGTDRMAAAAPAPAAAASQCRSPRCTAERRGVRRELDSWRHRLMHCVGFESILEGLYGPRLRRDLSLFEDCEPEELTDWSMDEKCSFCNLHKETVSDRTPIIGSSQSTPTEELSSQGQSNTDKIECQAENYLNALFRKKGGADDMLLLLSFLSAITFTPVAFNTELSYFFHFSLTYLTSTFAP